MTAAAATSFMNNSAHADGAMRSLTDAACICLAGRDRGEAQAEGLLSLDDQEPHEVPTAPADGAGPSRNEKTVRPRV